jgi:hydrogenase-4 membrane subunit HyfE
LTVADPCEPGFARATLAGVYLFSFLVAATSYRDPFPLFGSFYSGRGGEALVLADALVSLYLCLGILKRQQLTLWLIIGYNLFDIANGLVNLALLPPPAAALEARIDTITAVVFLTGLSGYVLAKRRCFNNTSPYLF